MSDWTLVGTQYSSVNRRAKIQGDLATPEQGITTGAQNSRIAFADPSRKPLPELHECYVRGEDLIASYPQTSDSSFGWHLAIALREVGQFEILHVTVAVQTELLDCHPMLDVVLSGDVIRSVPVAEAIDLPPSMHVEQRCNLASAVTLLALRPGYAIVMMPSRDWPVTGLHRSQGNTYWRLFEEFLEKGVIRKARLWIAFTDQEPTDKEAQDLYLRLCATPLPLTA